VLFRSPQNPKTPSNQTSHPKILKSYKWSNLTLEEKLVRGNRLSVLLRISTPR
jgi:hypothetical protein